MRKLFCRIELNVSGNDYDTIGGIGVRDYINVNFENNNYNK